MAYPKLVYLNGSIVAAEAAQVSVFDRGFIFGDGLYEVMVQIGGQMFYEKAHLNRLGEGLVKINIDFEVTTLKRPINDLLKAANLVDTDCLVYIQITRGVAARQHAYPKGIEPTVMLYAIPKTLPDINRIHAKVITREDFRWARCDIKMTSLLGNVMLNEEAMRNECYETVLVRNGVVTEASHCNIFFVKDEVVYTHPADTFILDGITRQVVIELCQKLHIELVMKPIEKSQITEMDEAFLTGTSTQIAAIQQIDDHWYYTGDTAKPITQKLQEAFLRLKNGVPV